MHLMGSLGYYLPKLINGLKQGNSQLIFHDLFFMSPNLPHGQKQFDVPFLNYFDPQKKYT